MNDMLLMLHFRLAAACSTNHGILPSLYDGITCGSSGPELETAADILKIAGNVTRILIALSGALAMVVIMAAAVYFVASAGDPGRIKRAKDILTNMSIGLVLIISAYAIVTYIAKGF
jgi:hypothetical protein